MFAGLKVLELASVLAGPSVGQFFAELGAEVIKVESPQGDVTRGWQIPGEESGDLSAYFCSCNWGKKSIVLDLRQKADQDVVHRLAAMSDIVIASYKPGDAARLGVDSLTLSALNERLIYGEISGYGPDDDRVGYDAVIQAESGFMDINGEAGGPPVKMPVALIDLLAAHQLKEGLLLALLQRERTGRGAHVAVSLMDSALASLANQGTNWLVAGTLPVRQGSVHPNIAPYGDVFETADKKNILFAVGNDRQYDDLLHALRVPVDHALRQPRFSTNRQRVANRPELIHSLGGFIRNLDASTILMEGKERKIPMGLIRSVKEALESGEKNLLHSVEGLAGIRTYVGDFPSRKETLAPPPHLGAHNDEIRKRIG